MVIGRTRSPSARRSAWPLSRCAPPSPGLTGVARREYRSATDISGPAGRERRMLDVLLVVMLAVLVLLSLWLLADPEVW
jgi:hypothetical protein